jgi:uncharacterized membrane protein HdeD (DUF308 family)
MTQAARESIVVWYGDFNPNRLKKLGMWLAVAGAIMVVSGGLLAVNLAFATIAVVFWVGVAMLFGGVLQIMHAMAVRKPGAIALWLVAGLLYLLAGFAVVSDPHFAARFFTLVLAIALAISGILKLGIAFARSHGWGWIAVSGALNMAIAAIIAMGWPTNAAWILGLFLAIDLLFQGWVLLVIGLAMRRLIATDAP